MTFKEKLIGISLTIFFSVFALLPLFEEKAEALEQPQKLYQVYLNGNSIGIIRSKKALETYINNEQTALKDKYKVSTVYLPQGLYIADYTGYSKNILTEKEIYRRIKDKAPFTIKGWVLTIDGDDPVKIYALEKQYFYDAANNVVKAFVPQDQIDAFNNGQTQEIKTVGSNIENLYIKEQDEMTVKEALISSDDKIFDNVKDLTRYMLFGNLKEQDQYDVKSGDTIESIAFDHKLSVEEFLIVNPGFNGSKSLLYTGEKVNVALVSPMITVVEEKNVVEDQEIKYKTQVKYDSSIPYGTTNVTQEGSNGLQRVTEKVKYENGEIVPPAVITGSEELTPAIDRIEVRGTYSISGPVTIGDGVWGWPTNVPYVITSPYGYRWGTLHDGVDISGCGYGSPIYAADNGNVYQSGYVTSGGGNQIIINHNNGYYTIYAHMSKLYVVKGQSVTRGQIIGLMGATGNATGTHLHFGAFYGGPPYEGGRSFNPLTLYR